MAPLSTAALLRSVKAVLHASPAGLCRLVCLKLPPPRELHRIPKRPVGTFQLERGVVGRRAGFGVDPERPLEVDGLTCPVVADPQSIPTSRHVAQMPSTSGLRELGCATSRIQTPLRGRVNPNQERVESG
jgi:hypothetical protein